jgi:type VI protein secretion system component VasF
VRIIFGWSAQIGGLDIPVWVSWLAVVIAGALAYFGFRQNIRPRGVEG